MPTVLTLNNSITWMLASQRNPNSVKKVKVGTTAITKKITLIPPSVCHHVRDTPNTENNR